MPKTLRRALIAAAAAVVGAAALVGAANAFVLARGGPLFESADHVPTRAVAIVPGARVHRDGSPYASLEDRLEAALALYRAGRVGRILVSGDHATEGYDEVNGMHRWLRERGVPDADIFMDHAGLRTLDTMQRAARVFLVRDAVICTQRYHLPRSVFLAREAGIDAVGLVADRRSYGSARRDAVREALARTAAVLDTMVLGTEPRFLGDPIPIEGDARSTHDRFTQRR